MTRTRLLVSAGVLALLLAPGEAEAHGTLLRASPPADALLTVAPREIRLTFSERPERLFTRILLTGPDAALVALDSIVIGPGNAAAAAIRGPLLAGIYTVEWITAGRDGHPLRGTYEFSIIEGAPGTVAATTAAPPTERLEPRVVAPAIEGTPAIFTPLAVLLRWLMLSAVIVAVGTVAFRFAVLGPLERAMDPGIAEGYVPQASRGAALLGLTAATLATIVAVARLWMQSATLHGLERGMDIDAFGGIIGGTAWGRAWLVQVAMALVAVASFALAKRPRHAAWKVAGAASVGIALGLALSGHAIVLPRLVTASVIAHVVHSVSAASWLGTLFTVVAVGFPLAFRLDRDDRWTVIADMVHIFSPAALTFAGIAVAAGVFIAWTHVGTIEALWTTEYGRILLLKLGLVAVTAMLGAYHWLRVRPSLGDVTAAKGLQRSAAAELIFAALIIGVTAVLIATPMPVS